MPGPGRNDRCPCGSGRKYKHCCLTRAQAATGITPTDRDAVVDALLRFSRRPEWDDVVEEAALMWAAEDFEDDARAALESIVATETSAGTFFDWLFFDLPLDDKRTLAAWFLDRHARTLNPRALDYLQLMQTTHLRGYQVRQVEPGVGLTVRDLWTDDELLITERSGSNQLVIWDVVVARVVAHGDGTRQIEGSVMLLPAACAPTLGKLLKSEHRDFTRRFPGEPLEQFFKIRAPVLHQVWDELVGAVEPPTLATPEGDAVSFTELVFDVPQAGEALVALLKQPDFEAGGFGEAVWVEPGSDPPRLLAQVTCDAGTLKLEAMSRERANRARARMEAVVGPIRLRSETHHEPDLTRPPGLMSGTDNQATDIERVPELAAWRDQQDRAWLDLEIPALDGKTPRQAVRDRRLKPRLVGLLLDIENREARLAAPKPVRDLAWMWKELGLKRP